MRQTDQFGLARFGILGQRLGYGGPYSRQMKNDFKIKEFTVIILTAIAGLTVGTLHGVVNYPELNRQIQHMTAEEAEVYRTPVILETCCVFFSTIYFVGQFLAKRIGNISSGVQLQDASQRHMRILHIFSGTSIVVRQVFFRPGGQSFSWHTIASLALGFTFVFLAAFLPKMPPFPTVFGVSKR